mmetsp:Transcript_18713/g.45836  ORF Transcript_18713/g.45836 Transcript_18713/m.45836 type:complete len:202 (+) Transcript_18713:237-842(+)
MPQGLSADFQLLGVDVQCTEEQPFRSDRLVLGMRQTTQIGEGPGNSRLQLRPSLLLFAQLLHRSQRIRQNGRCFAVTSNYHSFPYGNAQQQAVRAAGVIQCILRRRLTTKVRQSVLRHRWQTKGVTLGDCSGNLGDWLSERPRGVAVSQSPFEITNLKQLKSHLVLKCLDLCVRRTRQGFQSLVQKRVGMRPVAGKPECVG